MRALAGRLGIGTLCVAGLLCLYGLADAGQRPLGEQTLVASDGAANDMFGFVALAISGSTLVVGVTGDDIGANTDQGSVYVFERHGGSWVEQQKLTADDGAAGDGFGRYVAIHGDTLVVGAPGDDDGSNLNEGSVYVFERDRGLWSQGQKLTASDGLAGDQFGLNVSISGDVIVVSTRFSDVAGNVDQGSAYIFSRGGGFWTEQQKLTASDGTAGDQFGFSNTIDGSTIVVGAPLTDISGIANQGAVYVFERHGSFWSEEQKLIASDGAANDQFGFNALVSDGTIFVSSPMDDIGSNVNQGSTYVFEQQAGSWQEQQKLIASDGGANDQFGLPRASGSTVVIGGRLHDVGSNVDQGEAYVFERRGGAWIETQQLTADDGAAGDNFGFTLAIGGATIVVSAHLDDIGANVNQGSVHVFEP
jgi:hypothetical protein